MIANYVAEQEKFRELVESDGDPHILMLQGESGSGKSSLIEHCLGTLPRDGMPVARLDLQGSGDGITTLFNVMGAKMGRERLPSFRERVAGLIRQKVDADESVWRMQLKRQLREIGRMGDLDTLRDWHLQLTDTWFADVERFERPLLVVLDTYEQRDSLFDNWFRDEFLYGVANTTKLKVLVGGQAVPEPMSEWSSSMSVHALAGVTEAQAWMKWASEQRIEVPSLEWMARFCAMHNGNPGKIVQILNAFPKLELDNSKGPINKQRRRLRKMLNETFNLSELYDICFDMEVTYENLPNHGTLSGLIRELISHLGRIGRLQEFISLCADERSNLDWEGFV